MTYKQQFGADFLSNVSLFVIRYSLFVIRYSVMAVIVSG
ncbi:Erm Leader peptide [Moritella viscosa]|uniref:Erm Leader peptide n=1 Tax=Moritella viscosa TaxID=80854 RepID=A0A1L0C748_9GAMM|nr:Erm Leader peptide [Moritella viscosa]